MQTETASPPDRSRIAELEAQVASLQRELEAQVDEMSSLRAQAQQKSQQKSNKSKRRLRNGFSGALIAFTCILSATTLLAVWTSTTLLNTDRYVTTVAPLASNPAVQSTVADRVTTQLFSQVDVVGEVRAALPPNAQALAAPLTSQLKGFVNNQVQNLMATPAFATAWTAANRVTQSQITGLLLNQGSGRVLVNDNGTVSIDLHSLVNMALDQLQQSGVTLFQNVDTSKVQGSVALFQSTDLKNASTAAQALHTARYLAPIVLLLVVAGALILATNRRKATAWLGVAFAIGMLIVAGVVRIGQHVAVSHAATIGLPSNTATEIYNTLTRFLTRSDGVIFVLALVVIAAARFTGPGRLAVGLKTDIHKAADRIAAVATSEGWRSERLSVWIDHYLAAVRTVIIVVATLLLIWWSSPTILVLITFIAVTLVVLFLIEIVRAEEKFHAA